MSGEGLKKIGLKYGTDKADKSHTFKGLSYLDIYEKYFKDFKNKKINILELGVRGGNSLRTWKEYFPKATIYGLDYNNNCKSHEEDRIKVYIGDQDNIVLLNQICNESKGFDIIIDDASHINSLIIKSAKYLIPFLKSPGLYIIEDLKTSYEDLNKFIGKWNGVLQRNLKKGLDLKNNREDINKFIFNYIKKMDFSEGNFISIQFWSKICIMVKS